MSSLCLEPLFLRILLISKTLLNVLRFLVPIILIVKIIMDVYHQVLNPKDEEGKKHIINRLIACGIIFIIPTIVGVLFSFIGEVFGNNYSDLTVCREFSNLEYIETLEADIAKDELDKYNDEKTKNLSDYEQYVEAIRNYVASNAAATKVGENANNKNHIACGSGSQYNTALFNAVRTAGYKTRKGVVAAALYLSSHIDVHIPYFWSGGHGHTYERYPDIGDNFIGVSDKWGCSVKMISGGTDKQKPGYPYPFGMDCSGFVNWAILNGGYYTGDSSQVIYVPTGSSVFSKLEGINVSTVPASEAKGQVKPGDIAFKKGHVGLVVAVSNNNYTVAEEKGADYGLQISELSYGERFTDIVLMDNFYSSYKSGSPLWSGFK